MKRTVRWMAALYVAAAPASVWAIGQERYVEFAAPAGSFAVAQAGAAAPIYVDSSDYTGVVRAARDLQADVARVTGVTPQLVHEAGAMGAAPIIVGTAGRSALVDRLAREGKIDVSGLAGKWESFFLQVVEQPLPGVARALVIAGSDKRGTIYGVYDLSEQIGVSPWYWWADVPVVHKDALFVKAGKYAQGEPAVKYRGVFLNDEAPALTNWVREKFGNYNHYFYVKVFELLLRMKGNFLWPAMWNNAFNMEDPMNPALANEYGVVMSTSHHEPMMRAQKEWTWTGTGPWNYVTNGPTLREFWAGGVERNKDYESVITLAMRGDGDEPMTGSTDMAANQRLLEQIVADQRAIIQEKFQADPATVPQVWALYKEVQAYYEHGMRVPDDVTLLWCDDNWGNVRRLPTPEERKRSGGAGIYYHFDYVGGPRNYKWVNTVPIAKVWDQMNLAYEYDARRIWIVNVGDLKPMEFPIEFFLTMAWDPQRWPHEKLGEYARAWAEREFGPQHAADIADIVSKYTKYNGWRKPELLEPSTFSPENYREAERVLEAWKAITDKAEQIYASLPENAKDAFFQLVLYPTKACWQVNEMYVAAARNRLYAAQGRAAANDEAARVREMFRADADIAAAYHAMGGGRWNHMMSQTHIGYTYWQQPEVQTPPATAEINVPQAAAMGVAAGEAAPLKFDIFNQPSRYIEVFNRGQAPFEFTASASAPWIVLDKTGGRVEKQERLWVSVDWSKAPEGTASGYVEVAGAGGGPVRVAVEAFNPETPKRGAVGAFVEADGYVSIEAAHTTRQTGALAGDGRGGEALRGLRRWENVADYGRTLSSMIARPGTAESAAGEKAPTLEYKMYLFTAGPVKVNTIVAPTLNFVPGRGLRFAVSFDGETPQVVDALADNSQQAWEESVRNGVRTVQSAHTIAAPGYHTLKIRMVDPAVAIQKIVVDTGGLKPSYLGPPESYRE